MEYNNDYLQNAEWQGRHQQYVQYYSHGEAPFKQQKDENKNKTENNLKSN